MSPVLADKFITSEPDVADQSWAINELSLLQMGYQFSLRYILSHGVNFIIRYYKKYYPFFLKIYQGVIDKVL